MGKRPMRPKSSDGDREKLRAALDTGTNWRAVSPMKNLLQHSEEVRPLGAMRRGEPMQLKIVMVAGDPLRLFVERLCLSKIEGVGDFHVYLQFWNPGSHPQSRGPRPTLLGCQTFTPPDSAHRG